MSDTQSRLWQMERILEISRDLTSTVSVERLLHRIVDAAAELTNAEAVGLLLFDESSDDLRFVAVTSLADRLLSIPVPIQHSIAGEAFAASQPVIVADVNTDPRYFPAPEQHTGIKAQSLLAMPLQFKERKVGVLEAENKREGQFDQQDVDLLTALATQAVVAIENARLIESLQHAARRRDQLEALVEQRIAEIGRVEEKLRESEQVYRSILNASPDDITISDLQGMVRLVSPVGVRMFGYSSEREMIGRSALDFVATEGQARAREQLGRLSEGVLLKPQEYRAVRKDGSVFDIETNVEIVRAANGQPSSLIVVVRDITERKRVENALRESEERFALFMRYCPILVFMKDEHNRAIALSQTFEGLLGRPVSEMLGKTSEEIFPPEFAQHVRADDEAVLASGELKVIEEEFGRQYYSTSKFPIFRPNQPPMLGGYTIDITERKHMENALRESETLYRSLVEAMPQSLCRKDLEGRFTFANQRFCAEFHKSLDEIIGKTDFDIHPAELADKYHQDDQWIIETGNTLEIVEEHEPLGGSKTFVQVVKSPIHSADGKITGVQIMFWDVTARRQAEQAESEQRNLAEALRDIAAALNSTLELDEVLDRILANVGRVVPHDTANIALVDDQGVARIVRARGYVERGLHKTILSFRMPVFEFSTLRRMAETGQPLIVPDTHADAEWVRLSDTDWVRSYAGVPIRARGRTVGFLNLDSTAPGFFTLDHANRLQAFADQAALAIQNANLYAETRRRAEHMSILYRIGLAITSSLDLEQLSRTLLEQCRSVLPIDSFYVALYDEATFQITHPFFYDRDELRVVAPRDIRQQPGLSGAVIQRRRVLYLPDTLEPDTAAAFQIVRTGGPSTRSYVGVPLISRDHVIGVISMQSYEPNVYTAEQIHLLETLATQAAIAVENARLYTQARHHAQELEQANRKAEEARLVAEAANRAKSVFLANMSHELRTPLNAILGFSDLMSRDPQLTVEQKENLGIINRSGAHLLQLLNGVLEMAKIEAGHMTVQDQPLDLYGLLDGLVEMFRLRAADKGLALIVDRAPTVPECIMADENKLRQILINLLGNAVKFTASGGVELRISYSPCASADQNTRLYDGRLDIQVQDTGPGIAPQELEAIFEPFVQTESGEKAREGTGLGLAISRQFARLMGGTLTASSSGATGQGALFALELPVGLVHPPDLGDLPPSVKRIPVGLAPGQLAPDGSAYRLLIAEDRAESRELLVKLLSQLGFEVREAANGLEAINLWEKWRPHLIWMDLRMPVMDGHEAVRRIKATPEGQATIIIALTASAFEEEREQVLAEGCDDYVRKPIQQDQIADRLTHHLGVQFIYKDTAKGRAESYPPQDALDLTGLPAEWVASLKQATIEADAERVTALADQIRAQRSALASRLIKLVGDFDYQTILAAIGQINTGE